MAKPQQPEIARSGRGATDPGAVKSSVTAPAPVRGGEDVGGGPVPEDNVPGHHPEREQDKPSGDAFVRKVHDHAKDPAMSNAGTVPSPTERWDEPEPTVAGEALRAAAGVVRKVRESLPGD